MTGESSAGSTGCTVIVVVLILCLVVYGIMSANISNERRYRAIREHGAEAYRAGQSLDANPFIWPKHDEREHWYAGWMEESKKQAEEE
jgi:ribosome modulation factor